MAQYMPFQPVLDAFEGNLKSVGTAPVQQISMRPTLQIGLPNWFHCGSVFHRRDSSKFAGL